MKLTILKSKLSLFAVSTSALSLILVAGIANAEPKVSPMLAASEKDVDYTCPMHPDVHSREPGKCPKCGMQLAPSKGKDEKTGAMSGGEYYK